MRYIQAITEHEMVVAFLQAEITSPRFAFQILTRLQRGGQSRQIIDTPDTNNPEENVYRARLLGDYRGYRQNRDLFESFPQHVSWHRVALNRQELARVKYIDYSYWNELSGGTRLPVVAASNIRAGIRVFGQGTQNFLEAAQVLKRGVVFPELILVGTEPGSDLVVLEGHVRLTAFFLAPESIPEELLVIVGFSPGVASRS